jgi:hypothetical protein
VHILEATISQSAAAMICYNIRCLLSMMWNMMDYAVSAYPPCLLASLCHLHRQLPARDRTPGGEGGGVGITWLHSTPLKAGIDKVLHG